MDILTIMAGTIPIWFLLICIILMLIKNFEEIKRDNVKEYRKKLITAFHNAGYDTSIVAMEDELDDGSFEEMLKAQARRGRKNELSEM